MSSPRVIDLFCGAGGFSLGAYLAGFDVVASVDIDETLTSSYESNFPNSNLLIGDLSKLNVGRLLEMAGVAAGEVDGIVGGPPCQGFSMIGKRDARDPRNRLLRHFFRVISEVRPRFFVMENVPGLAAGTAKTSLAGAIADLRGYLLLGPLFLDAHDFGVPTRRRRLMLIGYDSERMHSISEAEIRSLGPPKTVTVREAISDLPSPNGSRFGAYRRRAELSEYARLARSEPREGLGSPASRTRLAAGIAEGVQRTDHTPEVVRRFRGVIPGKADSVSRCPRLAWSSAAPTLRAGTGPERGSFQAVRPLHPSQHRVITVREAARLQGFPDWFEFHKTKWHSFRMLGNSISPIMAQAVLSLIASKIRRD